MLDDSYRGLVSIITPYTASAGIIKHLSINPNITDLLGNVKTKAVKDLDDSSLGSVAENLAPWSTQHDSSSRVLMLGGQSNHTISMVGATPLPVSNGTDEALIYQSHYFNILPEDDGKIIAKNENFIKIKYDNGKIKSYRLNTVNRNSGKSAFVDTTKVLIQGMGLNSRVTKGQPIAYSPDFFVETADHKIIYKTGVLVNVAILQDQSDYEDSTGISETLSEYGTTNLIKHVAFMLDTNIKLDKDDSVDTPGINIDPISRPLLSYVNMIDDALLNTELFGDIDITQLSREKEFSHSSGLIREINIHYCPDKKMPMDKSLVNYINRVKRNSIEYFKTDGFLNDDEHPVEKKQNDVLIKEVKDGYKVNGYKLYEGKILIEFFISAKDKMKSGDKMVFSTSALKGVVANVMPDNKRPYYIDEYGETQVIDALLSPDSPLARIVTSPFRLSLANKSIEYITKHAAKMLDVDLIPVVKKKK